MCIGITISLFTLNSILIPNIRFVSTFGTDRDFSLQEKGKCHYLQIMKFHYIYIEHNTVMVTRLVTRLRRARFRFRWITFCFSFVPIYALSWVTFYQNQ